MVNEPPIVMICCSALCAEVDYLRRSYWPDILLRHQDSMLHIHPERLAARLETQVDEETTQGHRVVLVYGDCCERMEALEALPGVVRTWGMNCFDLLLGRDKYRRLSREGAFFLLPEWSCRWREIFTTELHLNRDNTVGLMHDMHRKLVYLDTGIVPLPEGELQACANFCGLPYEVRSVSLEHLKAAIQEALLRLEMKRVLI